MLAVERKSLIIEILNKHRFVKVADLSRELGITETTIRRDLEELHELKKARRVHGGAMAVSPSISATNRKELLVLNIEGKKLIAQKAFGFIDEGDTLILDSSTTVRELAIKIANSSLKQVSVITNSFDNVAILEQNRNISVYHTGGKNVSSSMFAVGTIAQNTLKNLKTDKCFLGTNGVDIEYGYSCPSFEEAAVKECMLEASKLKFVLADHTKLGETFMGKFSEYADIDFLIVDSLPKGLDKEKYSINVNLVISGASNENDQKRK